MVGSDGKSDEGESERASEGGGTAGWHGRRFGRLCDPPRPSACEGGTLGVTHTLLDEPDAPARWD